jgi:hypothetical protein
MGEIRQHISSFYGECIYVVSACGMSITEGESRELFTLHLSGASISTNFCDRLSMMEFRTSKHGLCFLWSAHFPFSSLSHACLKSACRYMVGETGEQDVPHREWLLIFDEVQNELKAELKRQGREDEFIGARVRSI